MIEKTETGIRFAPALTILGRARRDRPLDAVERIGCSEEIGSLLEACGFMASEMKAPDRQPDNSTERYPDVRSMALTAQKLAGLTEELLVLLDNTEIEKQVRRSFASRLRKAGEEAIGSRSSVLTAATDYKNLRRYVTLLDIAATDIVTHNRWSIEQRGAPTKEKYATPLLELADIFLRYTSQDIGRRDLPHSPRSHFIQFVHVILSPYAPATECAPDSLSKTWKKLKSEDA